MAQGFKMKVGLQSEDSVFTNLQGQLVSYDNVIPPLCPQPNCTQLASMFGVKERFIGWNAKNTNHDRGK